MTMLDPDLQRFRTALRHAVAGDIARSRSRRRATTRALRIGVPGLAVVLGASLAVVLDGSQAAFAGWSPTPTAATAGETSSAAATCRAQLGRTPSAPPGAAPATTGAWLEVATDVRGPFTLVVFESGGRTATCLSSSSMTLVSVNSAVGSSGRAESVGGVVVGRGGGVTGAASPGGGISTNSTRHLVPGAGAGIVNLSVTHLTSTAQGAYSVAVGAVQPGVGGVTLGLADGQRVEGTVGNGWLLAWWPGASDATSAQVTSASGTTTEPLGSTSPSAAGTPGGGGTTAATGNSGSPATGDS